MSDQPRKSASLQTINKIYSKHSTAFLKKAMHGFKNIISFVTKRLQMKYTYSDISFYYQKSTTLVVNRQITSVWSAVLYCTARYTENSKI